VSLADGAKGGIDMTGWKVPGYTELKGLGSGGFGDVVLARHDASGTLVAIKYLRRDLLADPEFTGMFRDEATVLASLNDPNVVRLYEYVESPAGAAIVMELVGGVALREILTFQGKTTPEAALVVLQGSLLGLAAAHRRGVVHRDYKPENVLVNGDGISKLTDFGIAARAGDRPVPAGTLAYAAPEQMAGAPASPASDVYAATATFYECLTGHPPFRGETADLVRQHQTEPVPLEPVPGPLRPLVAAGMAKNPGDRPSDATTFVTELSAAASRGYGRDWHDRGRSHLAEATLLLAALWPSGPPPAVQGTAVHQIPLRRRMNPRHFSAARTAIAASAAIAVAAAATALAATVANRPSPAGHPVAAVQSISLRPPPTQASQSQSQPPPTTQAPQSPPSLSPAQGPPGTAVTAAAAGWLGCSSMGASGWGRTLGTASIGDTGAFSLSFTVPSDASLGATQLRFSPICQHSTHTPSATFTVTPGPSRTSAPAAASNLTVTAVDAHDIRLDWQDNSGSETGFEISNGVVSRSTGPNSTSYTWGSLAPGTYMCFKIRAHNSAGDSPWEPDVSPWYRCTTTPRSPVSTASSTVSISSTTGWQKTPVHLEPGEKFTVTFVSGSWTVDYRNFPYVGPGGYSGQEDAKIYQGCKIATSETYGVLLGSVGSAPDGAILVGQGGTFSAESNGDLYLRINDNDACLGDNSGSVTVTITTSHLSYEYNHII
jgi:serine/threonine protein kinase